MIGYALLTLAMMVGWLTFYTVYHPSYWRAKDREGLIGILSWTLAMLSTLMFVILPTNGGPTTLGVIALTSGYSYRYFKRAQKERSYHDLQTAPTDHAA